MLKEMKYIYTVYEEKSFSRAARKLYISQPSLSAMVKKAEREWNIEIFDRTTSPISLTREGEYFIDVSKKILDLTDEMRRHFQECSNGISGSLTFGGSAYFCTNVFSGVVRHFQNMYPGIQVYWQERRNTELVDQLIRKKIDLAFEVDQIEEENISSMVVGREEVVLAVPANFEINKKLKAYCYRPGDKSSQIRSIQNTPGIDISHFREEPFVLLREGNDTYTRAMQICKNGGFLPNIVLKVDSVMTAYHLAMAGTGIAFVRDSLLRNEQSDRLCIYRLNDPLSLRRIMLYHRTEDAASSVTETFLSYMRNLADSV